MVGKTYFSERPRLTAVLQALLVTFIWSLSWVFIKIGLEDVPPLTFAGLRYFIGFLFLLPLFLRSPEAKTIRNIPRRSWIILVVLGVVYYSLNQGAIFVGLAHLPAVTLNLMLGFSSPTVAILGIVILREMITRKQWLGIAITIGGAVVYFYPLDFPAGQWLGYGAAIVAFTSTAGASIIGRGIEPKRPSFILNHYRYQHGHWRNHLAGDWHCYSRTALVKLADLAAHRLAGFGTYGLYLHPLESYAQDLTSG